MTTEKWQENQSKSKLKRKEYEKELRKLQTELCHLQAWVALNSL